DALSLLCNLDRHLLGHGRPRDAPTRAAVHTGGSAAQSALGLQYSPGEHAAIPAHDHASVAIDAFRSVRSGHTLPGCGARVGLAALSCGVADWEPVSRFCAAPLPQRGDAVKLSKGREGRDG